MNYLSAYLHFLSIERGLSPLTQKSYARDIKALLRLSQDTDLATLKINHVRRYIAQLHGQNLSGKTIARMLSSWRGWFDYLIERHGFTHNPIIGLRAPKSAKTLPQALSIEQAVQLVNIKGDDILSVRDHAILELFYSSGLRLAELVSLNLEQLDLAEGMVTVTGKGNKTRIVPIGSHALTALRAWLLQRESLLTPQSEEKSLFISQRGQRLSARNIQYRLKTWSIKQGIHASAHPHMLRHSFASHVLQSSGDLRAVQEMLGHANISTTQVYTHLDYQHLTKVYDKAHPRAHKKSVPHK